MTRDETLRELLALEYERVNGPMHKSAEFIRLTKYRGVVSVDLAVAAMHRAFEAASGNPIRDEQSEKARALIQARWVVEKHMKAFDCIITHPDTLKASIADAMYNFGQPPVIVTAVKE